MESLENKQRKIKISIRLNEDEYRILKKSKKYNILMVAFLR